MKIRSITYFCTLQHLLDEEALKRAGGFLAKARPAFEAAGYEVQTVRLATNPFPQILKAEVLNDLSKFANQFSAMMKEAGILYASLGPALPESARSYEVIPEAVAASEDIFFGGVMADARQIHMQALKACADVIVKLGSLDPHGFSNLRFAALANVKPGAPFFPAAHHDGGGPAFALAIECADLAVDAFSADLGLNEARQALTTMIEQHDKALERTTHELKDARFLGCDFSLAPFPDDTHSLGNAVEKMGVKRIGLHGSLAAAAILTEAIERADFRQVGFNGFVQPVLEDSVLAKRAAEGTLTVKDALLYSAVCGTGLDTVPLPGDASAAQIAPLLLDLCALALRLNKPLTARLMPIPGKQAGDATQFDFGFFANGKVMKLEAEELNFPLNGNGDISLNEKRPR